MADTDAKRQFLCSSQNLFLLLPCLPHCAGTHICEARLGSKSREQIQIKTEYGFFLIIIFFFLSFSSWSWAEFASLYACADALVKTRDKAAKEKKEAVSIRWNGHYQ